MKKKPNEGREPKRYSPRKKWLLILRMIVILLLVAGLTTSHAKPNAQAIKLNLMLRSGTVKNAIEEIERQTNLSFMYDHNVFNVDRIISLDVENESVNSVVEKLISGQDLKYEIMNRYIVISALNSPYQVQQQKSVSGKVTDNSGAPLPGVSVAVKGTSNGIITNIDGDYSLSNVPADAVLAFSFVGMETQEISCVRKSVINVILIESTVAINDVVITALGLRREKKALGYSVGEVKAEMLNRVPQQDLLGSLSGKMSGVKISSSSNDINADTYVNIRGITSLAGNNSPLVIVDGVPTGDQKVMKDISPNDIESVTVLKGPSAAALYGSRAGNGVILINSKSGQRNKNGIGVDVSVGTTYSVPYRYIDLQNRFTCGISGVLNENSYQQWNGPEEGVSAVQWNTDGVAQPLKFYDNALRDYFETGVSTVVDASVSGSYDRGSFRLSISHLGANGVYPGVELDRNGVNMAVTYDICKKVKVSANIDISNPSSDNYPVKNGGDTQYMAVYQTPPHVNINDLKDYWTTPNVLQRGINKAHDNPWFAAYELKDGFNRMRGFGNLKLDYQILTDLKVMGRYAFNSNNEKRVYRQAWSSYGGDGGGNSKAQGTYNETISNKREMNADFLVSYKKKFGKIELAPSVGGNLMTQRNYKMYAGGDPLVLPGLYTLSNVSRDGLTYFDKSYKKNIYSVYGLVNLSYNNMIYLDATARNDWSSTLPEANRSYFYPSVSMSVLVNEMVSLPSWVSLLKLRSGISQVGKDTDPYEIATVLDQGTWGSNTTYSVPSSLSNVNLKPEIASAFEIGTDVSFLDNRLGFDFTYYKVQNKNQILDASTSVMSGYTSATINAGNVENKGLEIGLYAVPVKTSDLTWNVNLNFTRERSQLKELTEGIDQFQFWESTSVYSWTKVGDYIGDIYGRDMLRVTEGEYKGWALLDSNGKLQRNDSDAEKIGNYMHDFMMGLQTSLSYKNVAISFSFDWRQGGEYYDQTMMRLTRAGKVEKFHKDANSSTFTGILSNNSFNGDNAALASEIKSHPEIYQNNTWVGGRTQDLGGFIYNGVYEGSFFPGVISDGNGGYIENFGEDGTKLIKAYDVYQPSGGFWSTATRNKWIYDASFIKLREVALSYTLPKTVSHLILAQNITLSAFMKNIILWAANKTNQDPESIYNQSNIYDPTSSTNVLKQGCSLWNASPIIMPAGFKINVTF